MKNGEDSRNRNNLTMQRHTGSNQSIENLGIVRVSKALHFGIGRYCYSGGAFGGGFGEAGGSANSSKFWRFNCDTRFSTYGVCFAIRKKMGKGNWTFVSTGASSSEFEPVASFSLMEIVSGLAVTDQQFRKS
jgi:hypothetical protein